MSTKGVTNPSLPARVAELVAEVKVHKAAIRRHRLQLSQAAAALRSLELECAARGIRLIIQAKGTNPWPTVPSSSTSIP